MQFCKELYLRGLSQVQNSYPDSLWIKLDHNFLSLKKDITWLQFKFYKNTPVEIMIQNKYVQVCLVTLRNIISMFSNQCLINCTLFVNSRNQ